MKKEIYEKTIEVLNKLLSGCEELKNNVYLVGGCVRDLQLGLTPKDIDLCIDYPQGVDILVEYLKTNHPTVCHGFTVFPKYGTGKFILKVSDTDEVDIECVIPRVETYNSGPRKPDSIKQTSIEEDAMRRDFCCNALYKNILTGEILDPTGRGIEDCEKRILRTPLKPSQTYIDDPLRMLRAIRFACTKDFTIEDETRYHIKLYHEYDKLSMERIRDEFEKILMSPNAIWGIRELMENFLMRRIIPEFTLYLEFDQKSKYHHLSWFEHSMAVFEYVVTKWKHASLELRWAALLHDISKPTTYQTKSDGSYSFHGHEITSGVRARDILLELKYSNEVAEKVKFLVENHMCIKPFYSYKTKEYTGKPKKTRAIIRHLGDDLMNEMKLIEADNMSHKPEYCMKGQVDSFWKKFEEVRDWKDQNNSNRFTVPVNGNDIIAEFSFPSGGRIVGEIKNILQDYYDENPNLTKEELIKMYREEFNTTFWIAIEDWGEAKVFLGEPKKKDDYWQSNAEFDYGMPLGIEGYTQTLPLKSCNAMFNPIVWRRLLREMKSKRLVRDISEKILEMENISGVGEIKISYDDHDLCATIRWEDGSETNIL